MSQLTTGTAYIFSWFAEDDGMIHAFGMTPENETVHLIILNFTRYCYIELPPEIDWDNPIHQRSFQEAVGSMNQEIYPQQMVFMKKHRLYRAHMVKTDQGYQRCLFPYLFVCFKTQKAMIDFTRRVSWGIYIESIGRKINLRSHEQDASPFLQLAVCRNIPITGWIDFTGVKQSDDWNSSYCKHEYVLNWNTLSASKDQKLLKTLPKVKIVSFDWEANSTNHNRMPNEKKPGDVLFQCSMSVFEHGSDKIENHLLTLGYPDPAKVSEGRTDPVKIHHYATEADILEGFAKMIIELDPQVITGYNIMGWDFNYMIARAKLNNVYQSFSQFGYIKGMSAKEKNITWSSSAFSKQSFSYPAIAGRIIIDMLPVIKRGFKFASYTLSNVSVEILGPNQTKDPLTPQGIFKCFQIGSPETLSIVGKYCVRDSEVTSFLFQKLKTWVDSCQMSSIMGVPIFDLSTQGQQVKIYAQIYRDCFLKNTVVEKNGYVCEKDESYTGAIVLTPIPGLHENVVTFDFASLYPSVIVEKNICYSTWVIDPNIPDEDCHVLEWEDHINCPHDTEKRSDKKKVMCAKRKYRFLKTPQGILPNILTRLTAERKKVKKELEGVEEKEKEEKDPMLKKDLKMYATILDMTQIAIKTVSNSMYGVMGVTEGRLPFMPGAMSTTAGGRAAIMKAKKIILDRHPGKVIYGDTDSLMYIFDDMKRFEDEKGKIDYKALEKFCNKVSEEISCHFAKPMKLEFENIAEQFFILTKKRYISKLSNGKVKKRGIMLTRRDNAACSRKAYEGLLNLIFQKAPLDKIFDYIVEALNQIYSHYYPSKDYAITKSIKDIDTYKVKALSTELVARQRQLKNKFLPYVEPNNPQASKIEDEYKFRSLPAHVQLAETMRSRGSIVESGSRFAYVVTTKGGPSGKMWQKIESLEYYSRHQGMINLDSNYYGKALINPFDEVLQIMFQRQNFTKQQHKIRLQKYEMLQELKRLMAPQLIAE